MASACGCVWRQHVDMYGVSVWMSACGHDVVNMDGPIWMNRRMHILIWGAGRQPRSGYPAYLSFLAVVSCYSTRNERANMSTVGANRSCPVTHWNSSKTPHVSSSACCRSGLRRHSLHSLRCCSTSALVAIVVFSPSKSPTLPPFVQRSEVPPPPLCATPCIDPPLSNHLLRRTRDIRIYIKEGTKEASTNRPALTNYDGLLLLRLPEQNLRPSSPPRIHAAPDSRHLAP